MKKNVRIGLMAGLLLAPGAVVAHANDPNTNAAIPYNTVASITEQDRILAIFSTVNEESTGTDIARMKQLFDKLTASEQQEISAEYKVLQAKVEYLNTMYGLITEARDLKTKIDTLQLTSGTLIQDVKEIEDRYDALNYAVNLAQTDFKVIFNASTSVRKGEVAASLLHFDNSEAENEQFVAQHMPNVATLQSVSQLVIAPSLFIDKHLENLKELNEMSYKAHVIAARQDYNNLTADGKKIVDAALDGEKTATQYLVQAEATVTNVEKVNTAYNEVRQLLNPTAAVFTAKVAALKNAVDAIAPEYQRLFTPEIPEIETYTEVISLMEGIQSIATTAPIDVAGKIEDLTKRYDALSTVYRSYVSNGGVLIQAQSDLKKAQAADKLVEVITGENLDATLPKASDMYKELSQSQKNMMRLQDALLTWQKGSNSSGLVVKNISTIKLIPDANFVKNVKAARVAFEKLGNPVIEGEPFEPTRDQRLVGNYPWLVQLANYESFVAQYSTVKSTNNNYRTEVPRLIAALKAIQYDETAISTAQKQELDAFIKKMADSLDAHALDIENADHIVNLITQLQSPTLKPEELLLKANEARLLYNDKGYLSADAKKLVTNLHILTQVEQANKAVTKITAEIDKLPASFNSKTVSKKIETAKKNYDSLAASDKQYVYNAPLLEVLLPVQRFMAAVDGLKVTSENYPQQVEDLTAQYQHIIGTLTMTNNEALRETLGKQYYIKLLDAKADIEAARKVSDLITKLSMAQGQSAAMYVDEINTAYKRLKSAQKKLVVGYDQFKIINNEFKKSLKVVTALQTLPTLNEKNAKSFATKFTKALQQFEKLTDKERAYVYNQDLFKRYEKAAPLMLDIANLKVTAKDYKAQVTELQARYEALSAAEKVYVANYSLLEKAQAAQGTADEVIQLIKLAIPTAPDFIAQIRVARAAYDELSKDEKKLVTNYKDLTDREKSVKPIITLDEQIELLPTYATAKTFISKYNSVYKSYEKLTLPQRALLMNEKILTEELPPIFKVMNQINSIKTTSNTFVADVKSARDAFEKLTAEQKAKVLNVEDLQGFEFNVDGGKEIDEMIRALNGSEPTNYIANVKAARAAYNKLTAANKKAVTLYDVLVEEEKYIKPVEQAIEYITQLARTTSNLTPIYTKTKRVIDTLSDDQLKLVTNIHLFQDLDSVMRTVELIDKIKPSDKYYIGNTQAAKLAYDKLSAEDRMKVANFTKLEEAVGNLSALDTVVKNINSLSATSSTYFEDVARVTDVYNKLPASLRKQVANLDILEKAQKDVAAAEKVMTLIQNIDPTVRTFETRTKAARAAYIKLTTDQQKLVANYQTLVGYENELGL